MFRLHPPLKEHFNPWVLEARVNGLTKFFTRVSSSPLLIAAKIVSLSYNWNITFALSLSLS
jgi:hypothetical protein